MLWGQDLATQELLGVPWGSLSSLWQRAEGRLSSKAMENWVRGTQPAFPLPLLSAQKQKGFSSLHFHFIRFPFLITRRRQWILWLLLMDAVEMDQCAEPALDSVPPTLCGEGSGHVFQCNSFGGVLLSKEQGRSRDGKK